MRVKLLACLAIWLSTSLGVAGTAQAESRLILGLSADYSTFDPGHAYEIWANTVINVTYDKLVKFEGLGDVPELDAAKSRSASADGLTWTFKLRDDVYFVSGNKLTSADVKWSFDRVKHLKGNPAFLASNVESVTAPDDETVVIKLGYTDSSFISKLATSAFAILDSKTVEAMGGASGEGASERDTVKAGLNQMSAGSGPYMLESFVPDSEVILVKNPNYRSEVPGADRIHLRAMNDANSQLLAIQKGDIDIAFNINSEHAKQLEGKKGVKILSSDTMLINFLLMNMDAEIGGPMSNPDVQDAVRYALDYRGLQTIAGSGAITPQSFIQRGFLGALPPRDPDFQDLEKAKSLMAKAGYADGFTVIFDVATYAMQGVSWTILGEKIASDLAQIGITCEIRTSEIMVGLAEYRAGKQAFAIWGWGPDYPDPNNQLAFGPGEKVGGDRVNWTAEMHPELVALIKKAKKETNDAKRGKYLELIQTIDAEDGPYAFLLQLGRQFAVRDNIENAYTNYYQLDLDQIIKN